MDAKTTPTDTKLFLHPDTYLCRIDDGAVILDLRRHKYFAVEPTEVAQLELALVGMRPAETRTDQGTTTDQGNSEFLESLCSAGILVRSADVGKTAELTFCMPEDSLGSAPCCAFRSPPRLHHFFSLLQIYWQVRVNLAFGRLKPLIEGIRRRKLPSRVSRLSRSECLDDGLTDLVTIFRNLRPLIYTAHDECLLDSLVLCMFLLRYRKPATFIIGVQTKPFLAHAWVQVGAHVLDDRVERIQRVTPPIVVV